MTSEDAKKQPPADAPPGQPQRERGTGEGADTALEALIRKRRQAGLPDPPEELPKPPDT